MFLFTSEFILKWNSVGFRFQIAVFVKSSKRLILFIYVLYLQEATRLSLVSGDQASYARSIRIMGDIYRKKSDINVSTY